MERAAASAATKDVLIMRRAQQDDRHQDNRAHRDRCGIGVAESDGMAFLDESIKLLGLGSLFFGAWGLVHPSSIGALTGDGPQASRQLGIRDTVIGVGLFTPASPVAVAARCASDAHDAVRIRTKSPAIALIAAVTVVWDAAVLVELLRARRSVVA